MFEVMKVIVLGPRIRGPIVNGLSAQLQFLLRHSHECFLATRCIERKHLGPRCGRSARHRDSDNDKGNNDSPDALRHEAEGSNNQRFEYWKRLRAPG
jgi:hypothetical protein